MRELKRSKKFESNYRDPMLRVSDCGSTLLHYMEDLSMYDGDLSDKLDAAYEDVLELVNAINGEYPKR